MILTSNALSTHLSLIRRIHSIDISHRNALTTKETSRDVTVFVGSSETMLGFNRDDYLGLSQNRSLTLLSDITSEGVRNCIIFAIFNEVTR